MKRAPLCPHKNVIETSRSWLQEQERKILLIHFYCKDCKKLYCRDGNFAASLKGQTHSTTGDER